jgi:ElaB/YqjD/DUF883 family membrane-anchored ribosome-binding protein
MLKTKLEQYNEIEQALEELKDDFKSQLQYIQEIQEGKSILENLDYLIRDNSKLKHNHTTETRLRAIQVLKNWENEIEGDQN